MTGGDTYLMAELVAGWAWPANSRKAHYYLAGEFISLCRKWAYTGERSNNKHESPDNCNDCQKRRERMVEHMKPMVEH